MITCVVERTRSPFFFFYKFLEWSGKSWWVIIAGKKENEEAGKYFQKSFISLWYALELWFVHVYMYSFDSCKNYVSSPVSIFSQFHLWIACGWFSMYISCLRVRLNLSSFSYLLKRNINRKWAIKKEYQFTPSPSSSFIIRSQTFNWH